MNTIASDSSAPLSAPSTSGSADVLALSARLFLAALFILAGINKISGAEGTIGYIASVGLPFAQGVFFATVALEIVGGLMLAVGFKTRLAAIALGLFSVACAIVFHSDFGDQMQITNFLKNLAIAGGMLQIAAFGAGRLSVDRG